MFILLFMLINPRYLTKHYHLYYDIVVYYKIRTMGKMCLFGNTLCNVVFMCS